MTENEQIKAAKKFSHDWLGHGNEEQDYQTFWDTLLRDIFGVEKPEKIRKCQEHVKIGKTFGKIDVLLPKTKVLIEQKSFGVDLSEKICQHGEFLTPFEQAKRYADNLPFSERPHWIITCNFSEFRIYNLDCMKDPDKYRQNYLLKNKNNFVLPTEEDIEKAIAQPTIISLENFHNDYKYLEFLVNQNIEMILPDVQISTAAADIVSKISEALKKNYQKNSVENYKNLIDKICTRLVFCFYANDANIFSGDKFFRECSHY